MYGDASAGLADISSLNLATRPQSIYPFLVFYQLHCSFLFFSFLFSPPLSQTQCGEVSSLGFLGRHSLVPSEERWGKIWRSTYIRIVEAFAGLETLR